MNESFDKDFSNHTPRCIGVLMLIINDYSPPKNKNHILTHTFVTI